MFIVHVSPTEHQLSSLLLIPSSLCFTTSSRTSSFSTCRYVVPSKIGAILRNLTLEDYGEQLLLLKIASAEHTLLFCFSPFKMEDDYYPKPLQEELNEIVEAFYAMISEEDIKTYQTFLEHIEEKRVAEGAVKACSKAPEFELQDQDNETVRLKDLLEKGPVVIVFYRGKWCPHCNATLLAMQRVLPQIQEKGATLVAISPMLPDGTQVFATKRDLQFPVLSDFGNEIARKYKITFTVPEEVRPTFEAWNEDIPAHNGPSCPWEIPLPATYIVNTNGIITWSFIDNDPGCRGEPDDVVAAIPEGGSGARSHEGEKRNLDGAASKKTRKGIKKSMGRLFGRKKEPPEKYIGQFLIPDD